LASSAEPFCQSITFCPCPSFPGCRR
jgi:hypothetical protein